MKIELVDTPTAKFCDIDVGECFYYNKNLYLKTSISSLSFGGEAWNLNKKEFGNFSHNHRVTDCDTSILFHMKGLKLNEE